QFDFLVSTSEPGAYDEEIRALGGRILHSCSPRNVIQYSITFLDRLRSHGPYDVVHSHVYSYSGFVLSLAKLARVPIRIAHSHNDFRARGQQRPLIHRWYERLAFAAIRWSATVGLAASVGAAESLFGSDWQGDSRWR